MKRINTKSSLPNQEHFAKVMNPQIQRSTFDRSSGHKTTLNAGKLYPIFVDEALPGDTMNLSPTIVGRFATALKPIMDNVFIDVHWFSVPNRLVWENWQRFNGEQDNPNDSIDYLIPMMTVPEGGYPEGSIYDYFGIPTKVAGFEHSALPLRAYNLIYNTWYRDQNLQDSVTVNKTDGGDLSSDFGLLNRNKRKDYFTSALPWAQKNDPVSIPLGDSAEIYSNTTDPGDVIYINYPNATVGAGYGTMSPDDTIGFSGGLKHPDFLDVVEEGSLYADLSTATAVTINALREAFQIQKMYEKDARGGTRYIELIKSHFGITSPDARLQRPEYLGGSSTPLNLQPIAQTSASEDGSTPQGNLSAIGTFENNARGFTKTFTEHEYVIGLLSIRADLNYQQGLNKMWSRETRFDFYWPSFAHLGEQAILNKEIYTQGTEDDEGVFGYQERYAEMRYRPSQISGLYRSNATASLDVWHLAQEFGELPSLNEAFIAENPPIDRVIAVPGEDQFLIDMHFDLKHTRPMPTYATPGLVDHF